MGIFKDYGEIVLDLERLPSERAVETVLASIRKEGYHKEVSAKDVLGSPGLYEHTVVAAMIVDEVLADKEIIDGD